MNGLKIKKVKINLLQGLQIIEKSIQFELVSIVSESSESDS